MKTVKAYQRALSIIINKHHTIDFETIVYKLAEHNPTEFLKVYDMLIADGAKNELYNDDQVMTEALSVAKAEGVVPCIKFLRGKLNITLKESKELYDTKIEPYI